MRVDVHQHIWTEPLLAALTRRSSLPLVQRRDGLTVLHSAGERAYVIDVDAESPQKRRRRNQDDGVDVALIAISSPIGIESLPRAQADPLIDAHLEGIGALGPGFAAWGPVALDAARPADIDQALARGCIGISLPADALSDHDALAALAPLLQRVTEAMVPLLIHPGCARARLEASLTEPLWWRAMTDYVAQMQAAWLSFATLGRREHPELVVVFAMLAGGAPLLTERLGARGGPAIDLRDPLTFYDTSSFGPEALDAMARRVGAGQLVYGSDRPVAEPTVTGYDSSLKRNASQLLAPIASVAA